MVFKIFEEPDLNNPMNHLAFAVFKSIYIHFLFVPITHHNMLDDNQSLIQNIQMNYHHSL